MVGARHLLCRRRRRDAPEGARGGLDTQHRAGRCALGRALFPPDRPRRPRAQLRASSAPLDEAAKQRLALRCTVIRRFGSPVRRSATNVDRPPCLVRIEPETKRRESRHSFHGRSKVKAKWLLGLLSGALLAQPALAETYELKVAH